MAEITSKCHNRLQAVLCFEGLSESRQGGVGVWDPFQLWWQEKEVYLHNSLYQCAGPSLYLTSYYIIYMYVSSWLHLTGCVSEALWPSLILLPIFSCTNMVTAVKGCWRCCEITIEVLYSSAGQY